MTHYISSLDAHKHLRASMTACSWRAGWRSLLIREYEDPPEVEEFVTPATEDHLIVLVTDGRCNVEFRYRAGWQHFRSETGHIAMTAPGESARLRWRGDTTHRTLQLHLPAATITRVAGELSGKGRATSTLPNGLGNIDPLVRQMMLGLNDAFRNSAPDLYAETAAEMLAAHLLVRAGGQMKHAPVGANDARLRRVEDFMHENLASPLSLEMLAREAGVSRFHLLRLYKRMYGQTPLKRLTMLRMEEAKRLLKYRKETITTIAAICGYENPAHFATAFRRVVGVQPKSYSR